MPRIVGRLLIQNLELLPSGQALSANVGSGLYLPKNLDGGQITGVTDATISDYREVSFDGGVV